MKKNVWKSIFNKSNVKWWNWNNSILKKIKKKNQFMLTFETGNPGLEPEINPIDRKKNS